MISLATHSTPNFLTLAVTQISVWKAPISLSLLLASDSKEALQDIQKAQKCNKDFRKWVSIHVVYPKSLHDSCPILPIAENLEVDCSTFDPIILFNKYLPPFGIYPINVMRNVARIGAATDYSLISDVEMYYSEDFEEKLRPVVHKYLKNEQKNAIIIRRFEIEEKAIDQMPKNVIELKKLLNKKKMYFFHQLIFSSGHRIDRQSKWIEKSIRSDHLTVDEQRYRGSAWEPQPILHRNAPLCYERAPTRQRDMQYCIYELCRSGYHFLVPTHVFNVHPGVKRTASAYDNLVTLHQKPLTENAMANFSHLMDKKYGMNNRKCGRF
ncbi:unnamed protein product, partial [Mesorhabditis belari]|uniref:Uncharacterized protein n=1 Tax=Mesorhabditis belari TaxID=2138241 RepID=A0AAF3ESP3_9BILA